MDSGISIIIPTFNEEKTIISTLKELKKSKVEKEIIVVDGGSSDDTYQLAQRLADKVYKAEQSRGQQLNLGAENATKEILFFLHSDSKLEDGALLAIKTALEDPEIIGGCFSLKITDDAWPLRFISWSSNLRARYAKIMFGDQGIFIRKAIFDELGGYPEIELMEDWEFSKKMAKRGKLAYLSEKIYTSARRWHKFGIWKTIFLMHKIKFLYLLGVKPAKLKEIYRDAR